MKKFYLNAIALVALFIVAVSANAQTAIVAPAGDKLVNGGDYTMFNYCSLGNYLGRTSWDGALVNWGAGADTYLHFTAQENEDGSWSFFRTETSEEESTNYYMNVPSGTANVNIKSTELCKWFVTPSATDGFYQLKVGEGTNTDAVGYNMHMNSSCAYIVASYPGDSWYPDFYGGKLTNEEFPDGVYDVNDNFIMADSSSCNWAFVKTENVQGFVTKATGFSELNTFLGDYVYADSYADFKEGLITTYEACLAIYNGAEFYDEDVETIEAMLDAKLDLCGEIVKAESQENADAVLLAAIENAKNSFNTVTDTTSLVAATETLAKAIEDFELGSGDITSLGQNMSFEDLSSQNGATTTGVAAAPTGWTVTVGGVEANTVDELKSVGISGCWHGINEDSEGEGKDGAYSFGLWKSSIPDYQISQTLTSLENGTYTITAGLMVGANGSGSRRTTQRIFGNLNSTYFGTQEDYNLEELDQSEVYAFQGLTEPVTDRQLQLVTVKAYVYDGTLTFGFRTDGNISAANRTAGNSAGGDGWFKLDNFRIVKEGYNADDALAILDHFKSSLSSLMDRDGLKLYPSIRSNVNDILETANALTSESPVDDVNSSIVALSGIIGQAYASSESYEKLSNAIDKAYENAETYQNKQGVGEYTDVIMDVEDKWDNQEYDDEASVDAAIKSLDDALQACIESDEIEAGSDLTEYIKNASFENLSSQNYVENQGNVQNAPYGWNLTVAGQEVSTASEIVAAGIENWCCINSGDGIDVTFDDVQYTHQYTDGEHLWGIWTASVPETELSQTITLPQGVYELTCDMMVQNDWSGNCITTQRLFANNSVQMWARESDYGANFTEDMYAAQTYQQYNTNEDVTYFSYAGYDNDASYDYTSLLRPMSLKFVVGEDGIAKVGIRTNGIDMNGTDHPHNGAGWIKVDNFHLTCISLGAVTPVDIPTAIKNVETATSAKSSAIYDLSGRVVANPTKGMYIKNGKKYLVK